MPATKVLKILCANRHPALLPHKEQGLPEHTYHALSAQEIWNYLLINVIQQASRTLVVVARIDEELSSGVVINERTNL